MKEQTMSPASWQRNYLLDVRVWILIFFLLRLYGIGDAPLETWHNWRQALTNMIARNYLQEHSAFLYPQIDMDGNKPGVIGSEFPLFNYLIFLFAKLGGYAHWYGRLINLIVSSFGVFAFYKIVLRFFSKEHALYASILLLCSLWFSFSRKSMPDTFCVSLLLIGIHQLFCFVYDRRKLGLLLFFVFSALGILSKIPALFLLGLVLIPLLDSSVTSKIRVVIVGATCGVLALVFWWYFSWVPGILSSGGFQLYFPKGLIEGAGELMQYWPEALEKYYFSAMESFVATALVVGGVVLLIQQRMRSALLMLSLLSFVFVLFTFKTGAVFPKHNYYVLPFVPVMAFSGGFALCSIRSKKIQTLVLIVVLTESILNQQHDFRLKSTQLYKLRMEAVADQFSSRKDLFVINGGLSPQPIYFLNRRGWSLDEQQLITPGKIDSLRSLGARYLFIDKNERSGESFGDSLKPVFSDADFVVYSLNESKL